MKKTDVYPDQRTAKILITSIRAVKGAIAIFCLRHATAPKAVENFLLQTLRIVRLQLVNELTAAHHKEDEHQAYGHHAVEFI